VCLRVNVRPGEGLQELINAPPPLATVMNDKATMDTEVWSTVLVRVPWIQSWPWNDLAL